MSAISQQQTSKHQIITTLTACGLHEDDFEVIQKMGHDGRYVPTATKTVFEAIVINVRNLQAVLEHAEKISTVYRVNVLTLNDQPVYASIEHNNGTGIYRKEL